MEPTGLAPFTKMSLKWGSGLVILLVLIGWLLNTPEGLLGKGDAVGYAVCHRIDLRSFHLGDRVLPLCSRCTGMYVGALAGLGYQILFGRRRTGTPPLPVILMLISMVGFFFVDGVNSVTALLIQHGILYEPNNTLRLFSGTGMGLVIAAALFPAFNQTVWREYQDEPALPGIRSFLGLLGIAVVLDLLILSENQVILYAMALISSAGVVIILTMLYTMVCTMVTRQENRFDHWFQLSYVAMLGFGVGLLQIVVLDAIRFWLTGTWDGFHFG